MKMPGPAPKQRAAWAKLLPTWPMLASLLLPPMPDYHNDMVSLHLTMLPYIILKGEGRPSFAHSFTISWLRGGSGNAKTGQLLNLCHRLNVYIQSTNIFVLTPTPSEYGDCVSPLCLQSIEESKSHVLIDYKSMTGPALPGSPPSLWLPPEVSRICQEALHLPPTTTWNVPSSVCKTPA